MDRALGTYDVARAVPAVTLNGSSRSELCEEWAAFYTAIDKAMDAFPIESFHARNHAPKGPDAEAEALEQRINMLGDMDELRSAALKILEKLNGIEGVR